MRTAILLRLTLVVAVLTLAPMSTSAQSDGCPWCTTPTTCSEVAEDTPSGGCYNIGAGCQTIGGSCEINETFTATQRKVLLQDNGIEYHGTELAELWGTTVELTAIDDGLYAGWACNGQLSTLFKKDGDDRWVELDPALYGRRFALTKGLASPVASAGDL